MLSLVNYSDDESDNEISDEEETTTAIIPPKAAPAAVSSSRLNLPAPKTQTIDVTETAEQNHINTQKEQNGTFSEESSSITEDLIAMKLPKAKTDVKVMEEEDDEFLHKKAIPTAKPPPKPKMPVRITIPALSEFQDEAKVEKKVAPGPSKKGSGLLGMLPKPKTEQFITKEIPKVEEKVTSGVSQPSVVKKVTATTTSLVPDSVKRAQAAQAKSATQKASKALAESDSDSDNETDFFSLDKKVKLPEVSSNEIALMVAKKAAKIAENKNKLSQIDEEMPEEPQMQMPVPPAPLVDQEDLIKLTGGNRAKRARVEQGIDFIEISDADLKPSTNEFLRTQLASQTQFNPTGKLIGYDSTSKRKSQITFLAQKAVANEQELQAMWSANRQKQRASSSKYGF